MLEAVTHHGAGMQRWREKAVTADLRAKDRVELARLRAKIQTARRAKRARALAAQAACRDALVRVREKARRARAELRQQIAEATAAARGSCASSRVHVRELGVQSVGATKAELERLRADIRLRRRAEGARRAERLTKREARGESDDEVRNNIPRELEPVWARVKGHIKAGPRSSRTEAFLQWVHDNSASVERIINQALESDIEDLVRQEAAMQNPKRRRNPWVLIDARTGQHLRVATNAELERAARISPRDIGAGDPVRISATRAVYLDTGPGGSHTPGRFRNPSDRMYRVSLFATRGDPVGGFTIAVYAPNARAAAERAAKLEPGARVEYVQRLAGKATAGRLHRVNPRGVLRGSASGGRRGITWTTQSRTGKPAAWARVNETGASARAQGVYWSAAVRDSDDNVIGFIDSAHKSQRPLLATLASMRIPVRNPRRRNAGGGNYYKHLDRFEDATVRMLLDPTNPAHARARSKAGLAAMNAGADEAALQRSNVNAQATANHYARDWTHARMSSGALWAIPGRGHLISTPRHVKSYEAAIARQKRNPSGKFPVGTRVRSTLIYEQAMGGKMLMGSVVPGSSPRFVAVQWDHLKEPVYVAPVAIEPLHRKASMHANPSHLHTRRLAFYRNMAKGAVARGDRTKALHWRAKFVAESKRPSSANPRGKAKRNPIWGGGINGGNFEGGTMRWNRRGIGNPEPLPLVYFANGRWRVVFRGIEGEGGTRNEAMQSWRAAYARTNPRRRNPIMRAPPGNPDRYASARSGWSALAQQYPGALPKRSNPRNVSNYRRGWRWAKAKAAEGVTRDRIWHAAQTSTMGPPKATGHHGHGPTQRDEWLKGVLAYVHRMAKRNPRRGLVRGFSRKSIGKNIKRELGRGVKVGQARAIALSVARKAAKKKTGRIPKYLQKRNPKRASSPKVAWWRATVYGPGGKVVHRQVARANPSTARAGAAKLAARHGRVALDGPFAAKPAC